MLQIRSGRTLPCTIALDIWNKKHKMRVLLKRGQEGLPWGFGRKLKRKREANVHRVWMPEQEGEKHTTKETSTEAKERKGKGIATVESKYSPEKMTGERQATGIVIREASAGGVAGAPPGGSHWQRVAGAQAGQTWVAERRRKRARDVVTAEGAAGLRRRAVRRPPDVALGWALGEGGARARLRARRKARGAQHRAAGWPTQVRAEVVGGARRRIAGSEGEERHE
ncbi:hypothetical protein J5N97_020654 [Dioscorea zingiberensis]|uniref:Uncharacterized protein n=1 Tax=Dioscorea zingiberensis TaxID=325984 RepID=A0A9D5CGY6_9LILI|nr:hypothetical protein J5N97_020654 [Dioscorea zingiberensis]